MAFDTRFSSTCFNRWLSPATCRGNSLAISEDARTLVLTMWQEDGGGLGVTGVDTDESQMDSGAVYVLTR